MARSRVDAFFALLCTSSRYFAPHKRRQTRAQMQTPHRRERRGCEPLHESRGGVLASSASVWCGACWSLGTFFFLSPYPSLSGCRARTRDCDTPARRGTDGTGCWLISSVRSAGRGWHRWRIAIHAFFSVFFAVFSLLLALSRTLPPFSHTLCTLFPRVATRACHLRCAAWAGVRLRDGLAPFPAPTGSHVAWPFPSSICLHAACPLCLGRGRLRRVPCRPRVGAR